MILNMDLAREILISIEKYEEPTGWATINVNNYSNKEISYHIKKLYEAGLIVAENLTDSAGYDWKAKELTWEGHQFLNAARDKNIWHKAKTMISDKAESVSFEVFKAVLVQIAKEIIFSK